MQLPESLAFAALLISSTVISTVSGQDLCVPTCTGSGNDEVCIFTFSVDIFAGETGYYAVEGCDGVQPTLGMKFNVTHIFEQFNETNWFHPLGFAYGPDGVYRGNTELEKAERNPLSIVVCDDDDTTTASFCDFPQYMRNGEALCTDPDNCFADIGLDEYESVYFQMGREEWREAGNFSVAVTITDPATTEFFYFCHIHNGMSARIKVVDSSNEPVDEVDRIEIPYEYDSPSEFDLLCGTNNMSRFEDTSVLCPGMTFLCGESDDQFESCMSALDCAMHVEMRVDVNTDPTVTFMHQMIAHHRNAVNMAKVLLKQDPPSLACGTNYDGRRLQDDPCGDILGEGEATPVVTLLWDIINTQNHQITFMTSWLNDNSHEEFATCDGDTTNNQGLLIAGIVLCVLGCITLVASVVVSCKIKRESKASKSQANGSEVSKEDQKQVELS